MPNPKPLNPRHTFESFVAAPTNEHALQTAKAVASGEARKVTTFCGPTSTGKTHLLHAIVRVLNDEQPTLEVRFITAEDFVNAMREATHRGNIEGFRRGVRKIDALLVDDVQFLQTRRWAQGEFLHTLTVLSSDQDKIIVISSKLEPDELTFDESLRDVLISGSVAILEPLDFRAKLAILRTKAADVEFVLPEDVGSALASNERFSFGHILGIFTTLVARCTALSQTANVAMLDRIIENLAPTVSVSKISRIVSKHFGMSVDGLRTRSNSPTIVFPRQIAMYLAAEAGFSASEIGRELAKDRTTVLHSIQKIEEDAKRDQRLHDLLVSFSEQIDS